MACLKILRNVPTATSRCSGTIAVITPSRVYLTNLRWLPRPGRSSNPADSSFRFMILYGRGLSDTAFNLGYDGDDFWQNGGDRRRKMNFNGLGEILHGFFLAPTLACNFKLPTLCDVPIPLFPDDSGKSFLHGRSFTSARSS